MQQTFAQALKSSDPKQSIVSLVMPGWPLTTRFHEDSLVAAFWWVGHTDVNKDANMEMTTVTTKNVDLPCLINKVDLKMGDQLIQYRAKATAAAVPPASGVVVLAGAQPEAQKLKKARTI